MASDFDRILSELADMRRRMASVMRHGTIHEVGTGKQKGMYRINWGKKTVGEGPHLSPWTRVSQQHGFAAENMPLVKGQTVTSLSMDPNHLTALVFPHSESELNPRDEDASDEAHTYRIRKKPDEQQGAAAEEGGGDDPKYPKRKDDEDDFKVKRSYDGEVINAGKDATVSVTRSGIHLKFKDREVTLNADGIVLKIGGQEVKFDDSGWTHKTKGFKGIKAT